jgi:ATP-dependent DNA helicase DinG
VQRIGLNNPQTFRAESPFDYKRNCILYFPKRTSTPFDEVEWLSQEIEQLVQVCHGHALVLFTSYDQMGRVQQRLQGRVAYPLLTARRNGQLFVQAFKQLSNAVLFAAGPCWEGVDFPGDRVSLLIIIRLPFPVPDPVSDAEKAKYPDLHSYIQAEVIPTMQKKLRQGFGRAIRTETDTCTVAILDPRAAPGGRYHRAALDALPKMNMTQDIKDVEHFIRAVKGAEYFFA